jgi:hypothetical protein
MRKVCFRQAFTLKLSTCGDDGCKGGFIANQELNAA